MIISQFDYQDELILTVYRYYDIEEWHSQGIDHVKVQCLPINDT